MKKLILVLGMIFAHNAFALPNAVERFNSLFPYGTFDGDDCRVRVTRTVRGNVKVSVGNLLRRINYVIPKDQFYRYVPGKYFALRTQKKGVNRVESDYLFLSYQPEGINLLVGKSLYSPAESYDRNVDCTINYNY